MIIYYYYYYYIIFIIIIIIIIIIYIFFGLPVCARLPLHLGSCVPCPEVRLQVVFKSFQVKSILLDVADIEGSKQAVDKAHQMNDTLVRFCAGEVRRLLN